MITKTLISIGIGVAIGLSPLRNSSLAKFIIAITKCDLLEEKELNKLESNLKYDTIKISSISGFGLEIDFKFNLVIWVYFTEQ